MRKSAIGLTALLVLLMAAPTFAMDFTGMFSVGAYGGYGFGFGDAFKDYNEDFEGYSFKSTSDLQFAFGGQVRYFFTPNMGVTGGVDYQTWKFESTETTDNVLPKVSAFAADNSVTFKTTEHLLVFTADFTYLVSPEAMTVPYLMAGPGLYKPSESGADTKVGFNAGLGVLHFFSPMLALDAGGKFHMIPSAYDVESFDAEGNVTGTDSKAVTYVQAYVGFSYFFGAAE